MCTAEELSKQSLPILALVGVDGRKSRKTEIEVIKTCKI
jgi:hypothetical protein